MRTVCITYRRGGYRLRVEEVPLRVLVIRSWVTQPAAALMSLGGHRLCCDMPDWAWRTGWDRPSPGDPDYDPEDPRWLRHSLAGGLHHLARWLETYGYRKEKLVHEFPVSAADMAEHFPESVRDWLGEDDMLDDGELPQIPGEPGDDAMIVTKKDLRRTNGKIVL